MDYGALVDATEANRPKIVEAIRSGDPKTIVPTCPDFTLDQLAFHIGEFSTFWCHVLAEAMGREKPDYPSDPGAAGRVDWVDGILGSLIGELRAATAETPCWTWYEPDQSAGFIASRTCHELAIHRVDVQLAATGSAEPVDAAVAAAGIDEVFLLLAGYVASGQRGTPGRGETLHLHGTDFDPAEWFARLDPEAPTMTHEHAKGDLAVRAGVSDLEMLLYQRPTVGDVEFFGDRSVLGVFHGEFTFG